MTFVFVKGDEVVLRARPDSATGVVTDVLISGSEPQYKVYFPTGTQVYSARHLDLASATIGTEVDCAAVGTLAPSRGVVPVGGLGPERRRQTRVLDPRRSTLEIDAFSHNARPTRPGLRSAQSSTVLRPGTRIRWRRMRPTHALGARCSR